MEHDLNRLMISTARCQLRPFEEADLASFAYYRNNEAWMVYQSFKNQPIEVYRKALLAPWKLEQGIQIAIADKVSDTLRGDLYLTKKGPTFTIGYTIDPAHARQGIITEVLTAFLPVLEAMDPKAEIVAMSDKDNMASKALLRKLGFVYDTWIEAWYSELYIYPKKT